MSPTRPKRAARPILRRAAVAALAEPLEPRRHLVVTIDGTSGADSIVVNRNGNDLVVTLNGSDTTYNVEFETNVEVFGYGGADTINIYELQSLICVVFAGAGDDTIRVGGGDLDNHLDNPVFVDGDSDNDLVILDDSLDVGVDDYDFSQDVPANGFGTRFTKVNDPGAYVNLDADIETVRLLCSDEANVISIEDRIDMGISTFDIQGRGGIDRCEFVQVNGIGTIDFDGGSASDRLVYEQFEGNIGGLAVNLLANSLSINAVTVATWASTQEVQVNVSGGDDIFNVQEVGTNIAVTVNPSAGDDLINVGNNDLDANIRGPLHISNFAGDGFNRLHLQDAVGTTPDAYTLTGTSLNKTGLAFPIVFFAEEHTLTANGGNNAISVASPSFQDAWIVNAGAGDDTLTYGSGDLRGRPATLNGGSGVDVLTFVDTDPPAGVITDKDYLFTAGVMTQRANNNSGNDTNFSYSSWATVNLDTGDHASTFTVNSLGGETTLNISAGAGNDDLFMTALNFPSTTFNYTNSGGFDTVRIDDSADALTADTYTFGQGTFDKTGFGLLNFSGIAQMTVQGSPTANTFDVLGLNVPTTITGGNAQDTITVGAGDIEDQILTNLVIQGNQGGDRLILNDAADTGDSSYAFTAGSFTKGSMLGRTIAHNTVEFVELNASPGNDTITAVAFGFPLAVTLRGAAGADTFNITPGTTIVTIEASDPTVAPGDVLQFSNAAAAGTATFTPNGAVNGTFAFASADPVTFFGVETFPAIPAAPSAPDLAPGSDSGASSTDNVTNDNTPTFTGTAATGVAVDLLIGGTVVASTIASGGAWSITAPAQGDGVLVVSARTRDFNSGLTGPSSGTLNVTIDTVAPVVPTVPDLLASSDSGASSTDNITNDNTPTFSGNGEDGSVVELLRPPGGPIFGSGTVTAGKYTITTTTLNNGTLVVAARATDLAGNASAVSGSLTLTIDTIAPTVTSAGFQFETGHALAYAFSENVSASLQATDLALQNLTTGTTIPSGSQAVVPATGTYTFPGVGSGILPDGNYRATLVGAGVTDLAGNALSTNHLHDFFVFAGDANRDRSVDIGDFSILASRFNLPGTFSQGDFNYTGMTEIGDFAILASKFNTSLSPARGGAPAAPHAPKANLHDRDRIELLYEQDTVLSDPD